MPTLRDHLIELGENSNEESDLLDFKQEYSPEKKAAFWAETVKDIVAFANTRGGIIVFGISDDGSSSSIDCRELFSLDNAILTDQIRKYTSADISGISIVRVNRFGTSYPAIFVEPVTVPLVFTKVGTYEVSKGIQKTAFSVGTIYFRHGSKSEPCTRTDIAQCIERQLKAVREEWLGNIRKVVEAPSGATVVVTQSSSSQGKVRITSDPAAPEFRLRRLSDGFPYRQSELIKEINRRLDGKTTINTHDIQAIKCHETIDEKSHPEFVSKPHDKASSQYSHAFADHIESRFNADLNYFTLCRDSWKSMNAP